MLPNQNQLQVDVRDFGSGLSKNAINHLFSQYNSSDKSVDNPGTGLGLALSKELMQLIDGDLELIETSAQGTLFRLTVPLKEVKKHSSMEEDNEALKKLLIVDDNEDILQFLNQELSSFFQCILARDGEEAFDLAKEVLPDIIISDVMMPKVTGIELAEKLKQELLTDHIPVLLLSAKTSAEQKNKGLKSGAVTYMTKPFDVEELKQTLFNYSTWIESLKAKYEVGDDQSSIDESALGNHQHPFIQKCVAIINDNIQNTEFSVNELADSLYLSRTQVHRKIKSLTGLSTTAIIRNIRLEYARDLIHSNNDMNVSEIAYESGFSSLSYFSKCYSVYFGIQPSVTNRDQS
jgi:YesN/AraC family two-component response regulator